MFWQEVSSRPLFSFLHWDSFVVLLIFLLRKQTLNHVELDNVRPDKQNMRLFADDAVLSVTVCLTLGGWQTGIGNRNDEKKTSSESIRDPGNPVGDHSLQSPRWQGSIKDPPPRSDTRQWSLRQLMLEKQRLMILHTEALTVRSHQNYWWIIWHGSGNSEASIQETSQSLNTENNTSEVSMILWSHRNPP